MSDATLRQAIREAQRAGRLGGLSDGAAGLLGRWATHLAGAVESTTASDTFARKVLSYCQASHSDEAMWFPESPEEVRELGAFLEQLAALL